MLKTKMPKKVATKMPKSKPTLNYQFTVYTTTGVFYSLNLLLDAKR